MRTYPSGTCSSSDHNDDGSDTLAEEDGGANWRVERREERSAVAHDDVGLGEGCKPAYHGIDSKSKEKRRKQDQRKSQREDGRERNASHLKQKHSQSNSLDVVKHS